MRLSQILKQFYAGHFTQLSNLFHLGITHFIFSQYILSLRKPLCSFILSVFHSQAVCLSIYSSMRSADKFSTGLRREWMRHETNRLFQISTPSSIHSVHHFLSFLNSSKHTPPKKKTRSFTTWLNIKSTNHLSSLSLYIYIYIYVCVCVCACAPVIQCL